MFKFAKGYSLKNMAGLEEGYTQYDEYSTIEANVSVEKIKDVLQHFIAFHEEKMFLILSLPVSSDRENPSLEGTVTATHSDVYYLDGCSQVECLKILEDYGELLINDGMSHFGFGGHETGDEIIVDKYNIIGIHSMDLSLYEGFFEAHDIEKKEPLITAWELISQENPGQSERVDINGLSVYDLPERLKEWGMYYAETRED